MSSLYGRAAKHIRSKSGKNNVNNNNSNDFSDSSSGDLLAMSKTTSRSRFAKALPAAPPLFGRLKTSRSSPNTGAVSSAQPPLPPLPAASSRFLSDLSYSYVPTSSTPGAAGVVLPPRIDSVPWAASAASINSSNSSLPQSPQSPHSPQSTQRPQRPQRPESKQLPNAPPPPPPPPPSQSQPKSQVPPSNFYGLAGTAEASTAVTSDPPIHRRPIAGADSVNDATTSPELDPAYPVPSMPEDRPTFDAFADLPQIPPLSPLNATIPETQAHTQTGLSPYPAPVPDSEDFNLRVASISSIISAYSHDSFEPTGTSSSLSDGTASTNNSSFVATSSPLRPLPEEKLNRSNDEPRQQKGDDESTPLSYLLEQEYGLVQHETVAGSASEQEGRSELPVKDVHREFGNSLSAGDLITEANRASVAPPPPDKDDNVRPAQSTNSLRHPPTLDFVAPAAATTAAASTLDSAASKAQDDALPILPSASISPSPKIWERRSEKTDKPISVPELKLATTAASPPAVAATADRTAEPISTKASNGTDPVFSRAPLPPPRSPLPPPPPSRSEPGQLQSSASPLGAGESNSAASASAPAPLSRVGLPGRNIRPSQQTSSASPTASSAVSDMGMGRSVNKLKAKLGLKTNVKEAPLPVQRLSTPEYDGVDDKQPNGKAAATQEVTPDTTGTTSAVNGLVSPSASAPYQTKDIDTPLATSPPQTYTREPFQQAQQAPQQAQQQFAPRISSRKAPGATASPPALVPSSYQDQYGEDADRAISETGSQLTIKGGASTLFTENEQQQQQQQQLEQSYTETAYRTNATKTDSFSNAADRDAPASGMSPLFPSGYLPSPVTADTVFAAPPPSRVQFQCFQGHRDMYHDRNMNYPLSCQACQTFERTPRVRCRWCYLRVCVDCRDLLFNQAGRDVAQLMALLKARGLPAQQLPLSKEMPMPVSLPEDLPSPGKNLHHVFSASSMRDLPVIREA